MNLKLALYVRLRIFQLLQTLQYPNEKNGYTTECIGIVSSAFMLLNAMFYSFMIGTVCFFLICFNNIVLLAVALLCGNIASLVYCLEYQGYRNGINRNGIP